MKTLLVSRYFASKKSPSPRLLAAMATMALTSSLPVFAATQTWDGAASGVWDTSALNWAGAAFTSSNDALFTGTPTNNVTTATGLTIGAITLNNTFTGSVALTGNNTVGGATTISGGTLSLSTATGLGTSAVTVNSGGTLALNAAGTAVDITYANSVTGAGRVQFLYNSTGNKDIFLNNLGTFTGTIQLSLAGGSVSTGGKARLGSGNATLSGTSSLIIDSGTQLYMGNGNATFANIQVSGTGNTENRGAIRSQSGTLTGAVSLMGNTTIGTEGGTIGGSISSGASGTQTLTLGTTNSTGALTLSSNIGGGTGTIALTKITAGTTTLSGTSTYTGGTTITAGTIAAGSNSALGSGAVTFNGGTLAASTNVTLANNLSTASGTANLNASGGTLVLNGNITGLLGANLTPTNKITLAGTNNFATTSANSFASLNINAGAGGVDITGSTTVGTGSATNANGYLNMAGTVTLTVQSGGSLTVNGSSAAPTSIVGQNAAGTSTLTVNGGSLTIGGNTGLAFGNNIGTAIGVLTISSGTATINSGSATATDARSFVMLGKDLSTGTINLNGGTLATDRNFVRDGSGTADASGAANFNFGGGTLKALANQTDWLNSSTKNTNQLALTSVTAATGTTSTIDANGFSVGINSAVSGSGGFNINSNTGTGTVTFGGAKTYTGGTTVTAGTLDVTGTLADTGAVTVSGGTYKVSNDDTVGAVTLTSGTISNASGKVLTGSSYAVQSGTVSGILGGSGALTKTTSGTVTLTNANTYTGTTTISAGTLALGSSGTLASTTINLGTSGSHGTLDLTSKGSFSLGDVFTPVTLSGYGTVNIGSGNTLTLSGTLAPGNSAGIVTITGNLAMDTDNVTNMEITGRNGGSPVAGTDYDQVIVSGSVTFVGTLNINTTASSLISGDTFKLFDAGTYAGHFDLVSVGGTYTAAMTYDAGSFTWNGYDATHDQNFSFSEVTGYFTAIPEPSTYSAIGGLLALGAVLIRRRAIRRSATPSV